MYDICRKGCLWVPINVKCSYVEFPNLKTDGVRELRACAKSDQDKVTIVDVTVDGVPLKDLKSYRVSPRLFNLTLPENNVLRLPPPQTTQAVYDGGYWVFS